MNPHSFHGMLRNLNTTYWMSFSTNGTNDEFLFGDIPDFDHIFRAYSREMLAPRGLDVVGGLARRRAERARRAGAAL